MFNLFHQGSLLTSLDLLQPNTNLYLNLKLLGGKKGKKKNYTTKKKNKHKHRKEKLATLKLYSVKNGKVQRERKVSPECGPGVFMAKHWDRLYCGRSHLTLKLDPATIKANLAALEAKRAAKGAEKVEEKVEQKKDDKKGKKGKKK